MNRLVYAGAVLTLCFAFGCEKKETPPPASEAATAAVPTAEAPVAAAPTPPPVDAASLPVEEQYEAEAEQELSAANLQEKLDALEKEIAQP